MTQADKDGNTRLHWSVVAGDLKYIRSLIKEGDQIDSLNNLGQTPLHLAYKRSQIEVATLLISLGADQAIRDMNGKLPLEYFESAL